MQDLHLGTEDRPSGEVSGVLLLAFHAATSGLKKAKIFSHDHRLDQVRVSNLICSTDCEREVEYRASLHGCQSVIAAFHVPQTFCLGHEPIPQRTGIPEL